MNISILTPNNCRPLSIDFDLYTDGDLEFKKELVVLMIDNLRELQQSLKAADQQNNLDIFRKTCHKIKPTISMLDDQDLNVNIDEMYADFSNVVTRQERNATLHSLCAGIIQSLEKES
jgi:hypothetical protein